MTEYEQELTEYELKLLKEAHRQDLPKVIKTAEVKYLIKKIKEEDGNINVQTFPNLDSALTLAVSHSSSSVIRAMLDGGINPNARNYKGRTALMYAAMWGQNNINELILLMLQKIQSWLLLYRCVAVFAVHR